jgi:hypothetical protein
MRDHPGNQKNNSILSQTIVQTSYNEIRDKKVDIIHIDKKLKRDSSLNN